MGDAHQVVVDDVGQEVGRQAVGLHQYLHVHAVPRDLDIATEHVRHHADAFARHLHADHMRLASGQAALHFFGRQQQGATVVARGFATGHLLGTHLVQLFGGAEAREGVAHVDQLLGVLLVDVAALALPVRAMRAADVRTFAPLDTEPAQGVEDLLFGLAGRTQLVGIFDTQDELAAVLLGKAVVEQGDVSGADVGIASRRRRDTRANGGHGQSRTRDETKAGC
ncbi:hypothetical protein D3C76_834820 [compost metagenome]